MAVSVLQLSMKNTFCLQVADHYIFPHHHFHFHFSLLPHADLHYALYSASTVILSQTLNFAGRRSRENSGRYSATISTDENTTFPPLDTLMKHLEAVVSGKVSEYVVQCIYS